MMRLKLLCLPCAALCCFTACAAQLLLLQASKIQKQKERHEEEDGRVDARASLERAAVRAEERDGVMTTSTATSTPPGVDQAIIR